MRLNLYDKDLNRIAVIGSQYVSCLWSEGYNTTQPFTMELQARVQRFTQQSQNNKIDTFVDVGNIPITR